MRRIGLILIVIVAAVFAGTLGWLLAHRNTTDPLKPDDNVHDLSIPPFSLVDQDGKTITNEVFRGRITILDFYFTHCKLICPALTQHMADQQRALRGTGVQLLSISVDPAHDTPGVIKEYAKEHGADPSAWTFATAPGTPAEAREAVGKIVQGGLKFLVGDDQRPETAIELGGGEKMNNIMHPSWFVLVGPKGEVLGIYLAEMDDQMSALTARAKAAMARLGK